jgi:hypothetical protein
MQVEVIHRLAAIRSYVDDNAIALPEVLLARELIGDAMQVAYQGLFLLAGSDLGERGDVLLWNDEVMHRSFGINVREGYCLLIFIEFVRGNFSGGDFAENAVGTHAL